MRVYFIQAGRNGHVKIGKARSVEDRLKTMQTGNSEELFIRLVLNFDSDKKAFEMERYFHRRFKPLKVRGEWFKNRVLSDLRQCSMERHESKMQNQMNKHKY